MWIYYNYYKLVNNFLNCPTFFKYLPSTIKYIFFLSLFVYGRLTKKLSQAFCPFLWEIIEIDKKNKTLWGAVYIHKKTLEYSFRFHVLSCELKTVKLSISFTSLHLNREKENKFWNSPAFIKPLLISQSFCFLYFFIGERDMTFKTGLLQKRARELRKVIISSLHGRTSVPTYMIGVL